MRVDKFLKVSRLIKRRTVANEACDASNNAQGAVDSLENQLGGSVFNHNKAPLFKCMLPKMRCCPYGSCTAFSQWGCPAGRRMRGLGIPHRPRSCPPEWRIHKRIYPAAEV